MLSMITKFSKLSKFFELIIGLDISNEYLLSIVKKCKTVHKEVNTGLYLKQNFSVTNATQIH